MKRWWLLLMTAATTACSPSGRSCGGKYLLLWPDARGSYAPTVVAAPSLADSSKLSGPAARIYHQARVGDFGYEGAVAEPHVTHAGDVCVPTDAGSAVAVSAYLQFERLREYDRALGAADHLAWPRRIGVEIQLTGPTSDSINNAHYVGTKDLVLLVPTTTAGVPAAMNHGIVAHEHFHAHFQSQVLRALTPASAVISTEAAGWLSPDGVVTSVGRLIRTVNDHVLRGWNEGLADLYAAVYLGRPEFLRDTFGSEELARARTLDGPPLYLANDVVPTLVRRFETAVGASRERAAGDLARNAYGQGSALARALWTVIHAAAAPPRATLAAMMKSLHRLPARINARAFVTQLDYGLILGTLLEDVPVTPAGCAHLRRVIRPGDSSFGRITTCVGY